MNKKGFVGIVAAIGGNSACQHSIRVKKTLTVREIIMGLANPGSNRAVMNEEVEMKNGGILAASFEFLGGFAALFLKVVTCRTSS